jgi:hypothetical protein
MQFIDRYHFIPTTVHLRSKGRHPVCRIMTIAHRSVYYRYKEYMMSRQQEDLLEVEGVAAHPLPRYVSVSIRSRTVTVRPFRAVRASAIRTSVSSRTEISCGRDQILSIVVADTSAALPNFVRFTRGSASATSRTRKRTMLSPLPGIYASLYLEAVS